MASPGNPLPWNDTATAVYHITHVGNLASMAASGAIGCDTKCVAQQLTPVSIAYDDLKARRARWSVTKAQGGTLADYVPFYFAPRSPMLYAINGGYVAGYSGGQAEVAHVVLGAQDLAAPGRFVITNGHAATPLTVQYDDLGALDTQIDWQIMRATYWSDSDEDGDRKRRRQAEFLVYYEVPFSAVRVIGVMTDTVADHVRTALDGAAHTPAIVIRRDWYY